MSRGCFVGVVYVIVDDSTSSAQLKLSETGNFGGSGWVWLKISDFSTFWEFSVKLVDPERVSKAEMIGIDARDSTGGSN
jgi:hypothetical protein